MAPRAKRTAEAGTGRVRFIWTIITVAAVVFWHQLLQHGGVAGDGQLWSQSLTTGVVADLIMVAATVVYTGSVAWMIVLVGSFCFVLAESSLEEGLMARHFPNEYPAYRARVKRLVPYLF